MLVSIPGAEPRAGDDHRVTYVLDRDLVRFAKFSGAVLGLFLVVGSYLFGFKLEAALDKVRETQESMNKAQSELEKAQKTVDTLKTQVETMLAEANSRVGEISTLRDKANTLYISIRRLNGPQTHELEAARASVPDKFPDNPSTKLWRNGMTLRVRFLDRSAGNQADVRRIASEWTKYANLKLEFVESGDAEIRVAFALNGGSWSYVGTDAIAIEPSEPTMNLGWVQQQNVLHEFGHALGLIEELQNPSAKIPWNKQLIYRELAGPPNYWSREDVDRQFFARPEKGTLPVTRDFDPTSIMTMAVPAKWVGGMVIGGGNQLSASDKSFIAALYPP